MKKFGERLQLVRRKENISQSVIAKELGITVRSYSCYERGAMYPSIQNLISISRILSVSLDYLFEITDDDRPEGERQLIEIYRGLNPEQQQKALSAFSSIVEAIK